MSEPPLEGGGGGCGQEFVLESTFAACDPQRTAPHSRQRQAPAGRVRARRVLQFVAAVTGRSADERQLRALRLMLEAAAAAGAGLDRATFHSVMGRWIQHCQRGSWLGEEPEAAAGDLGPEEGPAAPESEHGAGTGSAALELLSRAQHLASHNRKLQRDAEASEELNSRLGEELQQLRGQLRCTQQALERARAATEELEDTKAAVKGLEEENVELRRRMRTLVGAGGTPGEVTPTAPPAGTPMSPLVQEKEQNSLRSRADGLQEENQQLQSEGLELRRRLQALVAEVTRLEAQLCHCSDLLRAREATSTQAGQRVAELTAALEEYETAVREQRLEATRLRHQLNQLQETCGMQLWSLPSDTPMGQEEQDEAEGTSGTSTTSITGTTASGTTSSAAGTATSATSAASAATDSSSEPSAAAAAPSGPPSGPTGAPSAGLGAGAGAAAAALGGPGPGAAAAAPQTPPRVSPL
ncbi:protein KASH5 [Strigops habroptila]|uniref:protein KASH5 n=1 Tax=Strigops habroptila TaxID=2489341 RepID=UPI0011CF4206|nr:protein KASH5 [Strigops habroptila]